MLVNSHQIKIIIIINKEAFLFPFVIAESCLYLGIERMDHIVQQLLVCVVFFFFRCEQGKQRAS